MYHLGARRLCSDAFVSARSGPDAPAFPAVAMPVHMWRCALGMLPLRPPPPPESVFGAPELCVISLIYADLNMPPQALHGVPN